MSLELHKQRTRDIETNRIAELERQRQAAMEKCRYISDSARNNRTANITRNIGTLTMIFGAATAVGLLVFKEPTLVTIFSAVAMAGIAIRGNRAIHKNTTLKMNMHKQMVKMADERHDELATLNLRKTDLKEIPIPKYADYQVDARKYVDNNKQRILNKANYKIIQGTMASFAIIAGLSATINLLEKNKIIEIEKSITTYLRDFTKHKNKNPYVAPKPH